MTVKELEDKLNEVAQSQEFKDGLKKIIRHSQFHEYLEERVSFLIPLSLTLSIWTVCFYTSNGTEKVIGYTRQFVPYKTRFNNNERGHFNNVAFEALCPGDLLIEDLEMYFANKHKKERIQSLKNDIVLYQGYIVDNTKEIERLEEK